MEISYYPGCTLKTSALNYEKTALALLELYNIKVKELKDWVCCGATFSLTSDNLMHQLAPIRTLIRAKESGNKQLLTLCDMCYNTLKRASKFVEDDPEKRDKINDFMDREDVNYYGNEIEILHLLTVLENLGFDEIKKKVKLDLKGLKVSPYYGCMLLRPKEIAIDDVNAPTIMEDVLEASGCEIVTSPFRLECCASYQVVNRKEIILDRTKKIVNSARKRGADLIVLSCPLCDFNLDSAQLDLLELDSDFKTLPILYFTQLLALTAGIDPNINDFSLHHIDPRPILSEKGLL